MLIGECEIFHCDKEIENMLYINTNYLSLHVINIFIKRTKKKEFARIKQEYDTIHFKLQSEIFKNR